MHTSRTYSIFWLPPGYSYEPSGGNDSSYESLIVRFLSDISESSFYNILTQYGDSINGRILDSSNFGGSYVDTTPYPTAGTSSSPLFGSDVRAEITRVIIENGWKPGFDKIFFMFTAYGIQSCYDTIYTYCSFGSDGYCAYHDAYYQNNVTIIYANMPDDAFIREGKECPHGPVPETPNHDTYADYEISVASHELFEAVTDPTSAGWFDCGGSEIGDKCRTNFPNVDPSDGSNLILHGHKYIVQGEWSNRDVACVLSYQPGAAYRIQPNLARTGDFLLKISYYAFGTRMWTTTNSTASLLIYIDPNSEVKLTLFY